MSDDDKLSAISRRGLVGTVVVAGAAIAATQSSPASAQGATPLLVPGGAPVKATEGSQFRDVLRRLSSDTAYRNKAAADPTVLHQDFKLSIQDLRALRNAAVLSGVDVSKIDAMLNNIELSAYGAGAKPAFFDDGCCCCCCCGQAGAVVRIAPSRPS